MPDVGRTQQRRARRSGKPRPTATPGGRPLRLAYGSAARRRNPRRQYFIDVDDMLNVRRPPRAAEAPPWTCLTPCLSLHIAPFPWGIGPEARSTPRVAAGNRAGKAGYRAA